jgi:hypothetical protein
MGNIMVQYIRQGFVGEKHPFKRTLAHYLNSSPRYSIVRKTGEQDENGKDKFEKIDPEEFAFVQTERSGRIGVMVATGPGKVGFAIRSPEETRTPDWKFAKELAAKRANGEAKPIRAFNDVGEKEPYVPYFMKEQLRLFTERSMTYKFDE